MPLLARLISQLAAAPGSWGLLGLGPGAHLYPSEGLGPGAWGLGPGAWGLGHAAWGMGPPGASWGLEPGAWGLGPGTGAWNLELEPSAYSQ